MLLLLSRKTVLNLVDKLFPKSAKLHKIFDGNTVKEIYSCTENMANIIPLTTKKSSRKTPITRHHVIAGSKRNVH